MLDVDWLEPLTKPSAKTNKQKTTNEMNERNVYHMCVFFAAVSCIIEKCMRFVIVFGMWYGDIIHGFTFCFHSALRFL